MPVKDNDYAGMYDQVQVYVLISRKKGANSGPYGLKSFYKDWLCRQAAILFISSGVVRQQPPMILAPA